MATGHFIRQGDRTYCGGQVMAGDGRTTMSGMPHAREGDPVSCGKDGKVYKIWGGIGIITSNGKRPAGTLDSYSTCPCNAQFIPSMKHTYQKADRPAAQTTTQPGNKFTANSHFANSEPARQPPNTETYARSFTITDSETGQPLTNRKFIAMIDGREMPGVTDARGVAYVEAPSADSTVALHIIFNAPARALNELSEKGQ